MSFLICTQYPSPAHPTPKDPIIGPKRTYADTIILYDSPFNPMSGPIKGMLKAEVTYLSL